MVICKICNVDVSSDLVMRDHVKGKKHLRNAELLKYRQREADCSVYVTGFHHETTEQDLQEYFQRFGSVKKVYVNTKKGLFAFVEFIDSSSVKRATGRYYYRGNQLKVKPREVKPITTHPHEAHPKPQKDHLKMNVQIESVDAPLDHQEILQKIDNISSVADQMEELYNSLRLTEKDIRQRQEICAMLFRVLSPFFPGCSIHQFGSSVNGFGVRGCDIDIFLDFHDDVGESTVKQSVQSGKLDLPFVRDIKSLKKTYGPLLATDLAPMSLYDKTKLVSRILCEHAPGCNNTLTIPSARCPVVRFTHEPTDMKCDISVNNRLALRNTYLLQAYSNLDHRVKLLVFCIRYWAKLREVAGNLNSGPRLTNYALTLLVMYFLQSVNPPVLPTVHTLATLAGDQKVMIDGWNCSFLHKNEIIPQTDNTMSPDLLLKEFFKFFAEIDFGTWVLQTRTATKKFFTAFVQDLHVMDKLNTFKIGPVSVQDPFVLNHNITGNVSDKIKIKISEEFKIAACKTSKWNGSDEHQADRVGGLSDIFSDSVPEEVANILQGRQDSAGTAEEDNTFSIFLKVSQLDEDAFRHFKGADYRTDWCSSVCRFIKNVLEDVLLFKVTVVLPPTEKTLRQANTEIGITTEETDVTLRTSTAVYGREFVTSSDMDELKEDLDSDAAVPTGCETVQIKNLRPGNSSEIFLPDPNFQKECDNETSIKEHFCVEKSLELKETCLQENMETSGYDKIATEIPHYTESICSVEPACIENTSCIGGKRPSTETNDEPSDTKKSRLELQNSHQTVSGQEGRVTSPEYGYAVPEICAEYLCTSHCRTWNGRKNLRKEAYLEGDTGSLNLEKKISSKIFQQHGPAANFVANFKCELKSVVDSSRTAVVVKLDPLDCLKEFHSVFSFLKPFLTKLVDRHLYDE